MTGLETAALVAIAAGTVSAGASVAGGIAAKKQASIESHQQEMAGRLEAVEATDEEVRRRKMLAELDSTMVANQSVKGADFGASFQNLRDQNMNELQADLRKIQFNKTMSVYNRNLNSRLARGRGSAAMLNGILRGGGQLLSAGSKAYGIQQEAKDAKI
ncbi:MAG: hypothetical protein JKY34_08790 [Kordiimonadaceae bacterium]|nr:hypothetical protein [Kordiimonadaceae bacterium]